MKPNISADKLTAWREEFEKEDDEYVHDAGFDYFINTKWLYEELEKLNCPLDLLERILFAFGQRAAMYPNKTWEVSSEIIENYKIGKWEEPGRILAEQLIKEKYGDNPNPIQMLVDMINSPDGKNFGKLLGMPIEDIKAQITDIEKTIPQNMRN